MKKNSPQSSQVSPYFQPLVLGKERFTNFSAVEGIRPTPRLEAILAELDSKGLTGEERQKAILSWVTKPI